MTKKRHDICVARRPLSVVIIAKDEADRIEDCLRSVAWAEEIVVVDSGSTDATCDIARTYTPQVYQRPWLGFGPQKQAAVELATHDWILNLDCDERLTPELVAEIKAILALEQPLDAYSVPRRTFVGTTEIRHCGWYPDRTVRLFNRAKARYSDSLVHERILLEGAPAECKGHLLHYSFNGLADLLVKLNRYSDLSARQLYAQGRRCSLFDLTIRPLSAFLKTYLLKAGLLDGVAGLTISVTTALLTFAKYSKLRELWQHESGGCR
ncbi:MAG: glycosyltransferase family 2 protein [Geobacter sp.]|nr:glycosyltransferase family 2 protein [Geobacter sp.]